MAVPAHIVYWMQHDTDENEWHAWRSDEDQALCGFRSDKGIAGPLTGPPELDPSCSECRRLSGVDDEDGSIDGIELMIDLRRLFFESMPASTQDGAELRVLQASSVHEAIQLIDAFLDQEGIEVIESADDHDKDRSKD